MLDANLKREVRVLFENLISRYVIHVTVDPEHPSRGELLAILGDVESCSEAISLVVIDGLGLSFVISRDGEESAFRFEAIPNGHEFSTLLLAILNMDGKGRNIPDEYFIARIRGINERVEVTSYIMLTCPNCPDVVQSMNLISILNPNIRHRIVDGGLVADKMESLGIQAVPTLMIGGELFHVGRASLIDLVEKLERRMHSPISYEERHHKFDIVIVGGGPAGITAAIYSARKGFSVAIVADRIGGQTLDTQDIENITSIASIKGSTYAANLLGHMQHYPVELFENRKVESLSLMDGGGVQILTSMNEYLDSRALIIATGAHWRTLGIRGESEYIGRGVAFCTHCDAPFYAERRVVVVGGGNSGLEAALDLSNIASEVTLIEYAPTLSGDELLRDRVDKMANITVITNAQITQVVGDDAKVTDIEYTDRIGGQTHIVPTDGVFVQIGLLPNSEPFGEVVELTPSKEIVVDMACRTKTTGIYAAGDVTTVPYKQVVVAQGEGAKAALSAFEDIIMGVI